MKKIILRVEDTFEGGEHSSHSNPFYRKESTERAEHLQDLLCLELIMTMNSAVNW